MLRHKLSTIYIATHQLCHLTTHIILLSGEHSELIRDRDSHLSQYTMTLLLIMRSWDRSFFLKILEFLFLHRVVLKMWLWHQLWKVLRSFTVTVYTLFENCGNHQNYDCHFKFKNLGLEAFHTTQEKKKKGKVVTFQGKSINRGCGLLTL